MQALSWSQLQKHGLLTISRCSDRCKHRSVAGGEIFRSLTQFYRNWFPAVHFQAHPWENLYLRSSIYVQTWNAYRRDESYRTFDEADCQQRIAQWQNSMCQWFNSNLHKSLKHCNRDSDYLQSFGSMFEALVKLISAESMSPIAKWACNIIINGCRFTNCKLFNIIILLPDFS